MAKDGVRDSGEEGLAGITVYIDEDDDGILDPSERSIDTSDDLFYTPDVDEAGTYRFEKLAAGTYVVRHVVPDELSSTPLTEREPQRCKKTKQRGLRTFASLVA
jgi:hypothetical protein